jgi:3'-phosphoadenosine 5'-phosphosulfate sulfotransferase (PAPS reductase)/FAD synthetase
MVSSFGADSAVLLHMVAQIDRALPVLFIDTLALFPETVAYQRALAAHLGLSNIQTLTPDRSARCSPATLMGCCTAATRKPAASCANPTR